MNIDIPGVRHWSEDNMHLYTQLRENGYADFICNREDVIANYT